jgi:Cof subfamily protein (haloacid dehalogenase superfamily)
MIIFTDLDGTLLNSEHKFNNEDVNSLELLGNNNIIRVVATGRHIFSAKKVMKVDFPIDYLIFSTGAGILNWKTGEIIYKTSLSNEKIKSISEILIDKEICFALHKNIPDDHYFFSYSPKYIQDFENRKAIYKDFLTEISDFKNIIEATRFIATLSEDISEFNSLEKEISDKIDKIKIIRASSPFNGKNIWLEIYSDYVSKGLTAKWLCDYLKADYSETIGIGNDYNDIDLLEFTKQSYMVENAPIELKAKYKNTKSNDENGFSEVVKLYL